MIPPVMVVTLPVVTLLIGLLVRLPVLLLVGVLVAITGVIAAVGMLIPKAVFHFPALGTVVVTVIAAVAESHLISRISILSIRITRVIVRIGCIAAVVRLITVVVASFVGTSIGIIVGMHAILVGSTIRAIFSPVVQPALIISVVRISIVISILIAIGAVVTSLAISSVFL